MTKNTIASWFKEGKAFGYEYMIVVCDTYDHEDYPAYASNAEECREKFAHYNGNNMQRVMEVYDLSDDLQEQLAESRCMRLPTAKE